MTDCCFNNKRHKTYVCHFSTKHQWDDTRVFYNECCSLQRAGYQVTYLTAGEKSDEFLERGVQIKTIAKSKSRLGRVFWLPWQFYRTIRKLCPRPEICHFHDPELMLAGKLLQLHGYKVIYDIHEIVAKQILDKGYLPVFLRRFISIVYSFLEWLLTFSMAHVYVTEAPAHRPKRSAVLRNMPSAGDCPPLRTNVLPDSFKLIYIGGVSRSRGAIRMLELLRHLRKKGLNAELRILGWPRPPELREEMMCYLKDHSLEDYCYISTSRVDPVEVTKALYASDLGLCLLDACENYIRAFPVKIFEYLRAGLPVVATNIAYWRPMVERIGAGILVDISDVENIAEQIIKLAQNPQTLAQMSRNGRKIVESYWCFEKEQQYLLALYEDIITNGRGGCFSGAALGGVPLDGLELVENKK